MLKVLSGKSPLIALRIVLALGVLFAAVSSASADTAVINSVTFTVTNPVNTVPNTYGTTQYFTPVAQSFTVDAQSFTVSFNPVTVNVPTISKQITNFVPESTVTTGGEYIPRTLPPQYTPIVTITNPSYTQSLDIALNPFSFTLGASNNIPLNAPCSGSVFCVVPQVTSTPTLALTGTWTFTDTRTSGQQTGSFTEYLSFNSSLSNCTYCYPYGAKQYKLDLGQWPTAASLETSVMAFYNLTGSSGNTQTPMGSVTSILGSGVSNGYGVYLSNGAFSLNPVPVPASVWLMLSGLFGLATVGRKNEKKA